MRVSVIVAAYGRRKFLMDALRSIANQSKPPDEVFVVKNFLDREVDDYISRNGWVSIENDAVNYGEFIVPAVEEARGDVITFLEDDDVFEREKIAVIRRVFQRREVSYFHNARSYIIERPTLNPAEVLGIIRFLEGITPKRDVAINAFDNGVDRYIVKYRDVVSTVSLMSVRSKCIKGRIKELKKIKISIESFIPAIASECGLLYHTALRLTRYRIHSSSSIAFTRRDELRVLRNYARAIQDHEIVIKMLSHENKLRNAIRYLQSEAKLILLRAGLITFKSLSFKDVKGPCMYNVRSCPWIMKLIVKSLTKEIH